MKVTKMKRGYIIRLSDTEFELLRTIEEEGHMGFAEMHADDLTGLPKEEKRILTQVLNMTRDWMVITENRRDI